MTQFVLGFRFSPDRKLVALIRKTKPTWQAGKLNGIGGKVEPVDAFFGPHDAPAAAMAREFREETGFRTDRRDWRPFGELRHDGNVIHLLKSFGNCELRRTTDEQPDWFFIAGLHERLMMRNLLWMIPMALDTDDVFATINDHSKIAVAA